MKNLICLSLLFVLLSSFSEFKEPAKVVSNDNIAQATITIHDSIENLVISLKADCLGKCFQAFDKCTQGSPPYSGCFDDLFECIGNCPV